MRTVEIIMMLTKDDDEREVELPQLHSELFMVHMRTVVLSPSPDWRQADSASVLTSSRAPTIARWTMFNSQKRTFNCQASHPTSNTEAALYTYQAPPSLSFCPFLTLTAFVLGFVLGPVLSQQLCLSFFGSLDSLSRG